MAGSSNLFIVGLFFVALFGCERKPSIGTESRLVSSDSSTMAAVSSALPVSSLQEKASPSVGTTSSEYREVTWSFEDTPLGTMKVVVVIPESAGQRLPVLITMHGMGEAMKGPARGARGWVDDYWLPRALRRLHDLPLTPSDFRHRFQPLRLQGMNASLKQRPYRGLIVVCPYTPAEFLKGDRAFDDGKLLSDFIVDVLIPKVYEKTPAIGTPASTGIDGVSLGGRAAVLVGLSRPEAFGALGALQPAFDVADASRLAQRATLAHKTNPALVVRLLTSDGDYYLKSTKAISAAMIEAGVKNTLDVVAGDHSYDFNRGPGVYEMLFFHDRALRAEEYWVDSH